MLYTLILYNTVSTIFMVLLYVYLPYYTVYGVIRFRGIGKKYKTKCTEDTEAESKL